MGAFALSALKVAGALALVVLLGRYVTRPALRFVARSGLREVFSAVALFLVFGFGLLLEEVGLSMAMGAFLAGVLLASSEYRHALESDIEPFKGLLLGLFFIGVGMSIDFGTLVENPLRILLLLAGFLAIKIVMLWLVARPLGVPAKQRRWFAVLLGQGSEFAFVVFGAAQMADVLEPEWAKSADAGGRAVDGGYADFSGAADAHGRRPRRVKRARRMKSTKSNRGLLWPGLDDLVR
ncbi:glutathione-regulated potassium-efflux system protein KefC [Salmonella enterica subsp. enterica]|uniref:Glutathione-regulated potassium-efflux system protein KefC n=1 Tax=Salmonella enterica I TaxID=59201 RepID=A0A447TMQ0_SALET|nr:glutathione-regulated potassium-efflux system protein KefC [Salmonella enterica subsp. enterica]